MRVIIIAIYVLVPLVVGIIALTGMRHAMRTAVADTSFEVLRALDGASNLLTVTELTKITGRNGGVIITSLRFLYRQGLISSTHSVDTPEVAELSARFAINSEGRQALREIGKDN